MTNNFDKAAARVISAMYKSAEPASEPAGQASSFNVMPYLSAAGNAISSGVSDLSDNVKAVLPGGAIARAGGAEAKTQQLQQKDLAAKTNEQMLAALFGLGVAGVGAGLTTTKLYNLISGLNKPKNKYTKFGPGPKRIDDAEKIAELQVGATLQSLKDAISAGLAKARAAVPELPAVGKLTQDQQAFFIPAAMATGAGGLYGGYSLAKMLDDKKRKDDAELELQEAKNEYQRALTGKRAETLDSAFQAYKTAAEKTSSDPLAPVYFAKDVIAAPLKALQIWPHYVAATLGTGALAGKMTYDWTRERSKDKALERARRSRARMEENAPMYIDPAQLEAVKALHQKEIDKIRQKEIV